MVAACNDCAVEEPALRRPASLGRIVEYVTGAFAAVTGSVERLAGVGLAARGKTENRANRNVGARHAVPACSTDRNM